MKTHFAIIARDSLSDAEEPGWLIEVGKTLGLIRSEFEERFKGFSDEQFRNGDIGFYAASRKDHLDSIAFNEFNEQFGYGVAGRIMNAVEQCAEPDATLTLEFKAFTDEEWDAIPNDCDSVETLILFDFCGEQEPRFFIATGDLRHLDGVYINSASDKHSPKEKQDELSALFWNEDGSETELYGEPLETPPREWNYFIRCGLMP